MMRDERLLTSCFYDDDVGIEEAKTSLLSPFLFHCCVYFYECINAYLIIHIISTVLNSLLLSEYFYR